MSVTVRNTSLNQVSVDLPPDVRPARRARGLVRHTFEPLGQITFDASPAVLETHPGIAGLLKSGQLEVVGAQGEGPVIETPVEAAPPPAEVKAASAEFTFRAMPGTESGPGELLVLRPTPGWPARMQAATFECFEPADGGFVALCGPGAGEPVVTNQVPATAQGLSDFRCTEAVIPPRGELYLYRSSGTIGGKVVFTLAQAE